MEFPRFVYRDNGDQQRAGGTYCTIIVSSVSEYMSAINDGWFSNLQDAVDEPNKQTIVSNSPPSRWELENKAQGLGLKFDGRIGNKRLEALIEKHLES